MQEWLGPAGSVQPPLKAKRKLYCGKTTCLSIVYALLD